MKIIITATELMEKGVWDDFCDERGINIWAVNEGLMESDEEFSLTDDEIKKYGLFPNEEYEDFF